MNIVYEFHPSRYYVDVRRNLQRNLQRERCVPTIQVVVDLHLYSKFLSRDTHDRFVFPWSTPTLSSLESELSSSYRSELERWCRQGANVRTPKRIGTSAHWSGHGIDPGRRKGASFRSGARRFVGATGIGVP